MQQEPLTFFYWTDKYRGKKIVNRSAGGRGRWQRRSPESSVASVFSRALRRRRRQKQASERGAARRMTAIQVAWSREGDACRRRRTVASVALTHTHTFVCDGGLWRSIELASVEFSPAVPDLSAKEETRSDRTDRRFDTGRGHRATSTQ